MNIHSAVMEITPNLGPNAFLSSNWLFFSLISSNITIWRRKTQEKLKNRKVISLTTGSRPPFEIFGNPYVLSVSIFPKIKQKKSFNPYQFLCTSRSIQDTHFKKKKWGGRTSGFFVMDLNSTLTLAGSDFCENLRPFKQKVPFFLLQLF